MLHDGGLICIPGTRPTRRAVSRRMASCRPTPRSTRPTWLVATCKRMWASNSMRTGTTRARTLETARISTSTTSSAQGRLEQWATTIKPPLRSMAHCRILAPEMFAGRLDAQYNGGVRLRPAGIYRSVYAPFFDDSGRCWPVCCKPSLQSLWIRYDTIDVFIAVAPCLRP